MLTTKSTSCPETIDISQPSWRAELRRNLLEEDEADGSEPSAKEGKVDEAGNEEFDCSVKEPSVKSSTESPQDGIAAIGIC